MRATGWIVGVILLVGGPHAALADTPTTYCEFQDFAPTLCASNAISMTPTVTPANKAVTIVFHSNSQLDFGYQFEVVLANSKILANTALTSVADDPGILRRRLVSIPQEGGTQVSSGPISTSFGAPFYAFYRLNYFSGSNQLYSTPWKIYSGSDGTPTALCAESSCGPEMFSTKVGASQWFTRVSVDQSQVGAYSIIADNSTYQIPANCPDLSAFNYGTLEDATPACYKSNGRTVVLGFSNSQAALAKLATPTLTMKTGITEISGTAGQRIGQLITGIPITTFKTYMGAILDKASSIDNLDDVFADLNIRYGNLGTVAKVLGSGNTDGTGIQGRNEGWLYPRFIVSNQPQKTAILMSGIWKKQSLGSYYNGLSAESFNTATYNREAISIPIVLQGGIHAYLKNFNQAIYDLSSDPNATLSFDSLVVNVQSGTTQFDDLIRDGVWLGLPAGIVTGGRGAVSINSIPISDVAIDAVAAFMHEDIDYRGSVLNVLSGTEYDALVYKNTGDLIALNGGSKRVFAFDSRIAAASSIAFASTSSETDFSVSTDGNRMVFEASSQSNSSNVRSVDVRIFHSNDYDEVQFPLVVKVLLGVHYVVMGYTRPEADKFFRYDNLRAIKNYQKYLISIGEEPHFIYGSGMNSPDNFMKSPPRHFDDASTHGIDVWGLQPSEILSCMDGKAFSFGANSNGCGISDASPVVGVSGFTYFGHGFAVDANHLHGNLIVGKAFAREKATISDDCYDIAQKTQNCWSKSVVEPGFSFNELGDNANYEISGAFRPGAKFISYSCRPGRDWNDGGKSLIYRASKVWKIPAFGSENYVDIEELKRKDPDYVRFFELTGEPLPGSTEYDSQKSDFMALVDLGSGRVTKNASVWNHVNLRKCGFVNGVVNCDTTERIFPDFFDVVEK
jgi:hypothetical protein